MQGRNREVLARERLEVVQEVHQVRREGHHQVVQEVQGTLSPRQHDEGQAGRRLSQVVRRR